MSEQTGRPRAPRAAGARPLHRADAPDDGAHQADGESEVSTGSINLRAQHAGARPPPPFTGWRRLVDRLSGGRLPPSTGSAPAPDPDRETSPARRPPPDDRGQRTA